MSDEKDQAENKVVEYRKHSSAWRLRHVEKLVQEIHRCMVGGNKLEGGEPGLVDVVKENTKDIGAIQPRLAQLETAIQTIQEDRKVAARLRKIFYAALAGTVLVASFWDALTAMFTKIFK